MTAIYGSRGANGVILVTTKKGSYKKSTSVSYDFYYGLEDGTYLIYGIYFEEIPILLNGFKVDRNFKNFKKQLIKNYRKYFID